MSWWTEQRQVWARDWALIHPSKIYRAVGVVARIVTYVALFGLLCTVAYLAQPSINILEVPLAQLTLGAIISAVTFVLVVGIIASLLVTLAFNPSSEPTIKKYWSAYGTLLLILLIFSAGNYLSR